MKVDPSARGWYACEAFLAMIAGARDRIGPSCCWGGLAIKPVARTLRIGAIVCAGLALASPLNARKARPFDIAAARTAAAMFDKANACDEDDEATKRFSRHVLALGEQGSPGGTTGEQADEPATLLQIEFFDAAKCLMLVRKQVPLGNECAEQADVIAHNPYAGMSCRRFHRQFTRLKITRANWQVADGFR